MFSNRRNSQKPREGLYAAFKQSFPELGQGTSSAAQETQQGSAVLDEVLIDIPSTQRPFDTGEDVKDQDATPKPFQDWRLTPSLMDPNSFAFSAFANQPPGYYTPTPGGFNTIYHSQAGDLHTPGMGMNTPLSLPHSVHGIHTTDTALHLHQYNPHLLQQHTFSDAFAQQQIHQQHQQQHQQQQQQQSQQQSFAPAHFLHHDSGYAASDETPPKDTPTQNAMNMAPPNMAQITQLPPYPMMSMGEKFRYHTTLNAPTAMIKQADEIPITYLNKGQAYTISIFDTASPISSSHAPLRYRTFVRVSFEDEQQRARPGACWQLWKEGRGTNEAHQRDGKLLAVEYVDPNQGGDELLRKSQIELEMASFDGFIVNWYPNTAPGLPSCSISVRFNFLSTDFSHSKGVKGIPVRLCAKTQLISPSVIPEEMEVCYSKVKLFRDHGAERKLSNDVAHVKKTIDKLKQQIAQAESGVGNLGKRKRSGSVVKASTCKPGKALKHKRTWSVDSDGCETGRFSAEEDLHTKLQTMQDMFTSTRSVSVLFLRGEKGDDPDLYPVNLPGKALDINPLARANTWESRPSNSDSPTTNIASPSISTASPKSPKRKYSEVQQSNTEEWQDDETEPQVQLSNTPPARPVKIPKLETEAVAKDQLYAIDVDRNYKPPAEKPIKPVACFYIRSNDSENNYYRAVYLMSRTVKDLINEISAKFQIEAHRVTQVTHINSKGLRIIVDEDVVRELPEGQDMIVEFAPILTNHPVKHEFVPSVVTDAMVDGEVGFNDLAVSDPLEMWLNY